MINEIQLILNTHLAFYYRHPWLMLLFIIGFSLGSALLTAIAGLNQEAETRYQQSAALINDPVAHLIKPLTGKKFIDGDVWLALRQHGFINAQPILRGSIKNSEGQRLAIQGVNTLLWLNNPSPKQRGTQKNTLSPDSLLSTILIDTQFKQYIYSKSEAQKQFILSNNQRQPNFAFQDDIGLWAITDLAHADYLLNAQGKLSFIELSLLTDQEIERIKPLISGKAQLVNVEQQEFDVLSEAFFFNLSALAMLGYIVAVFLSFNAIKLTIDARKKLLEQMQILGCTKLSIQICLTVELVVVSLLTALLGTFGGYFIANALLIDVNRTLIGLYQLDNALVINWQWFNVLLGFGLNIIALAGILLAQTSLVRKKGPFLFFGSLLCTLVCFCWLLNYATTEFQALLLCFSILVLFFLLVPKVLAAMVSRPILIANPLAQWLYADTRYHLKDLHIAIVAILIALGCAIGMQIMVKSFSNTLNEHLEKQLNADIYLRSDTLDSALRHTLSQLPEVEQLSVYIRSDGQVNNIPAHLASFGETAEHYQHISLTSGAAITATSFSEKGCLANEQSKIKYGLSLGDVVQFTQNSSQFECRISGFFYDYGNPKVLLLTLEKRQKLTSLNRQNFGFSIRLGNDHTVASFSERLVNEFNQDSSTILANKRFKQYAKALFDDTFVVTKALNGLILAIALISLCTSLLSLSANQLTQLAVLRNLGVTSQQLIRMKLLQTASVVFFTTVFAVPLGFALGFALLKFVMPIAFGWTIHFSLDLATLILTCLALIGVSVVCAYLPVRRLMYLETREL